MNTFSEQNLLKALAIVRIFETSRPAGDFTACVVLNDGAGISYGAYQFTHRSGSLGDVVAKYLERGGRVARNTLSSALPILRRMDRKAVAALSDNSQLRRALMSAGITSEMRDAQNETAVELYLQPAITICERAGFVTPLSLAVVYDSYVHGSWERIARRVMPDSNEVRWITEYVQKRHFWLSNIRRLRSTTYRTKFFLDQITIGNWQLKLPVTVHGIRLAPEHLTGRAEKAATAPAEAIPANHPQEPRSNTAIDQPRPSLWPPNYKDVIERFDRFDDAITGVTARTDRAKSLWTTIIGTISQTVWAVIGWMAGLPIEIWITVAIIGGLLAVIYLYRQVALGKIRESRAGYVSSDAQIY